MKIELIFLPISPKNSMKKERKKEKKM